MNVTLNTDASFSKKHKVGSYAFWITCDGARRFFSAGPLKIPVETSTHAELMCIVKALVYLQQLQNNGVIPPVVNVRVNTDSLNSIHIMTNDEAAKKRYQLNRRFYKKVVWHWIKVRKFPEWKIEFKHVRSHVATTTARQYVNDWCDRKAKEHIQILISQKEKL